MALLGTGLFCQELLNFLHGQQNWHDLHADVPIALSVPFVLVGLFLCQRYRVSFDRPQQRMTWTRSSLFGSKSRTMPFQKINDADYEVDPNQFVNDHPKWGPMKRLIIRTEEGSLPMASLYTYGSASGDRAVAAINDFLGRKPGSLSSSSEENVRKLLAKGDTRQAIALICKREHCQPAEAWKIVERMQD